MDIFIGFAIIFGAMVLLCVVAVIIYKVINVKNKHESAASLPQGTDQSEYARLLQDKYKGERDNGEFQRQGFN